MTARLQIVQPVQKGLPMLVRLLIQHPMETGFRHDMSGSVVPKNVIHSVLVRYNGQLVFQANLGSGIAANPLLEFWVRATQPGEMQLEWLDDQGVAGQVQTAVQF